MLSLGRQGLAFRGHRDESTADEDSNKGNFLALLSFRGKSGDKILDEHLETCKKNARYCSKTIQNEFISIIGNQIRSSLLQEVK